MATAIQQQYEELSNRVHKAIEWLDSPGRTEEEIDKWLPRYEALFDEWKALEKRVEGKCG